MNTMARGTSKVDVLVDYLSVKGQRTTYLVLLPDAKTHSSTLVQMSSSTDAYAKAKIELFK